MEVVLENVSKTLKGVRIIDDVSMSLTGGRVYGIQGCNGSGKTMLMRLMAGLLRPTSGHVWIDGKKLGKDMDFPPSIGVFLENPSFLPGYTGFENLELIASLRDVANEEAIKKAIARVGLDPEDKRKYRKYSLGMKQRLGIACAIFEKPEILLLDEPTNALDKDGVQLVGDIIRGERDRGALVVLSSHEQALLAELADVIYTMENGKIVSCSAGGVG